MNLLRSWVQPAATRTRSFWPFFNFGGQTYPITLQQTLQGKEDELPATFEALVQRAYASNGIVFACMLARQMLFSEARFAFRRWTDGEPSELFGTQALRPLERPWSNGSTRDLLNWAIQSADLSGNAFVARRSGGRLARLRSDWVTLVMGSEGDPDTQMGDIDAEVLGLIYHPGGRGGGRKPVALLAEEFAHFYPIPDPLAPWRGMSPLATITREVMADSAATDHKLAFFSRGATPNMIVSLDPAIVQQEWRDWVDAFDEKYGGVANAYKTMYLGAGSKAEVVGANFQQMDFKVTQGAGETRVAAAFGVPPIIVGLSEGLSSATYSNYSTAKRRFGDMTMRPLWGNIANSLEPLIDVPAGAELWYDDRQIPALLEDITDRASVQSTNASAIRQLVDAGFKPDTVVDAIVAGNLKKLIHTDLYSVQLQPPGTTAPEPAASPAPAQPAPEPAPRSRLDIPTRWYDGGRNQSVRLEDLLPDGTRFWFPRLEERHPGHSPQSVHAGKGGAGALDYGQLEGEAEAGGFSVTIHGSAPSTGCMVSPYKRAERVYAVADFEADDVKAYRDNHRELLSRPEHYLGGWRDGDKVYLDVSIHTENRTQAAALAKEHGQLAFYDLDSGETVPTAA